MAKYSSNLTIKRIYEPAEKEDGFRILIDRLWPQGLSKEKAHIDLWLKEIAPSTELRKWFGHDPEKWNFFKNKYTAELKNNAEAVSAIEEKIKKRKVCLVYAARDEIHNDAIVLREFLSGK